MSHSQKSNRALIVLVYLLPLVVGVICLALALTPHLWLNYNGEAHETLSPIKLMANTWETCQWALDGNAADQSIVFFSYTMIFFCLLSWLLAALYGLFAVMTAIFSIRAFLAPPATREANRAKRWLHLLCPNAVTYAIFGALPLIPSFFPYLLIYFYRTQLWIEMDLFFYGLPDPVWAGVLVLALELGFWLTRKAQASERMDMFRLYKKKTQD